VEIFQRFSEKYNPPIDGTPKTKWNHGDWNALIQSPITTTHFALPNLYLQPIVPIKHRTGLAKARDVIFVELKEEHQYAV